MDMVNISLSTAAITGLLGYVVGFVGLILLMLVIMLMSKMFIAKANAAKAEPAAVEAAPAAADTLGKPLNQLRFISIKEVKE